MPEKPLDEKLDEIVSMGKAGLDLLSATAETIRTLSQKNDSILTGDPVADAAILRAIGVETVIKSKFNVDSGKVIQVLNLLLDAFSTVASFYKD